MRAAVTTKWGQDEAFEDKSGTLTTAKCAYNTSHYEFL